MIAGLSDLLRRMLDDLRPVIKRNFNSCYVPSAEDERRLKH
jgi:hypothetical protein